MWRGQAQVVFDLAAIETLLGFPGGSEGKESTCSMGDLALIPGLGRSPGGGHGNLFQYSYLKNSYGQRSLAGFSPWGCKESDMTEWLRTHRETLSFAELPPFLSLATESRLLSDLFCLCLLAFPVCLLHQFQIRKIQKLVSCHFLHPLVVCFFLFFSIVLYLFYTQCPGFLVLSREKNRKN